MRTGDSGQPGPGAAHNIAQPGSIVENQAYEIHHHNRHFHITPEDTAEQRYIVGRRYLEAGSPRRAEELISEAIRRRHDQAEVQFHWLLAMFSKRSFRDLGEDERDRLRAAMLTFDFYDPEDRYTDALQALGLLIQHLLDGATGDAVAAEAALHELDEDLLDKISYHLVDVLAGVTAQRLWERTLERARGARFANERTARARVYFEPTPAMPRRGAPAAGYEAPEGHPAEVAGVAVCALAVSILGWLTLSGGSPWGVAALMVLLVAGAVLGRDLFGWMYRADRVSLNERRHHGNGFAEDGSRDGKGFVSQLRHSMNFYYARHRPADVSAQEWLDLTAGVRQRLREELAETFREQRTCAESLHWLIRYHAIEDKRSFEAGTFHDLGAASRPDWRAALRFLGALAVAVAAAVVLFRASSLAGQLVLLVVLVSGCLAVSVGYRLYRARRSAADDEAEAAALLDRRRQEFERWKQTISDQMPTEQEMETWLLSDITVLIGKVLEEAKWKRCEVVSNAVIRQPGPGWRRGRVDDGPWRYSKYQLRIYLVTVDGVREVTADLDFRTGEIGKVSRENFQLDSITSVKVIEEVNGGRVLAVMLNNGEPREIRVAEGVIAAEAVGSEADDGLGDGETTQAPPDPDLVKLVRLNLDATGFDHALRLLEGIGADGKGWIRRHARA
ncbi:hypothetical protein SAMN05428985_101254 [Nocardioides sp. YR527]|uniref:hypothetical protein n=1 Tax=Nocardioides sp. YR527 TaxID=1881028 RepID=UPI00088812F0|nr:hypothetical protein [Nocardioides sp. YR527]SDJ74851.1 hypothetical protein SAMN05428985_101254 [Nocardioides sp. YR527]